MTNGTINGTIPGLDQLHAGSWEIDPVHSAASFVVRHAMISKVRGSFSGLSGEITIGEDPLDSSVTAVIDLASVDTGNADRDAHLRAPDFFDVEQYPELTFVSTGVRPGDDGYVLSGDVTVHGVTRPVELALDFHGVTQDPFGSTRAGFSATTELNRKDFGLQYNVALEAGGVLISDKVKVELDIAAVRKV